MQRVLIDLFCGRGGWTKAAQRHGWKAIGYDITDHGYPGELHTTPLPVPLIELTRHRPSLIIASPPCEDFARHHLPWIAKPTPPDETLLRWSVQLITTAPCPVIVECSRFAGWHVPGARWYPPYCLWGAVPALLPIYKHNKDRARGSSSLPKAERAARAAEIPPELADWILYFYTKGTSHELSTVGGAGTNQTRQTTSKGKGET